MEVSQYTQDEYENIMLQYTNGRFSSLDDAFHLLSPKAILFLKHGCTEEEWDDQAGYRL